MKDVRNRNGRRTIIALRAAIAERLEQRQLLTASITSGQTIAGNIAHAGQQDAYSFSAAAGQTFVASAGGGTSGNYAAALKVIAPDGTVVIDRSNNQTSSSVVAAYTVPTDKGGTFTAIASDYYSTGTGAYDFEIVVAPGTLAASGDGKAVVSGETIAAAISHPGDIDAYTFSAGAGQTFVASAGAGASSNYAGALKIIAPDGTIVADQGNNQTSSSVRITYTVPGGKGGTYTAVASDYYSTGAGAYDFEVIAAPGALATTGDAKAVISGQTVVAAIDHPGDIDGYTFSASAGQTFVASAGAGALSNYAAALKIIAPDGNVVVDRGNNQTASSAIASYTVPAGKGGTYTAIVSDYYSTNAGAYDFEVIVAPGTLAASGDGKPVVSGQTIAAVISHPGDIDAYAFSASVKDTFIASVGAAASSNYAAGLEIIAPDGKVVYDQGNNQTSSSVTATYTVPAGEAGTFTAVASDYYSTSTGAYDFQLNGNLHPVNPTLTVTAPASQAAAVAVAKSFSLGSFTASQTTSPYTVDVNWGDGSADTFVNVSVPGTIPTQSHAYAKSGSDTVSIVVTDAKANASNKATFAVTVAASGNTGSIVGNVFKDINANGVLNPGEAGLVGVKVYLDTNKNGKADSGEPATVTDTSGNYSFLNLAAGTYRVSEVVPAGYKVIAPALGYFDQAVVAGKVAPAVSFADAPAMASISGEVFNDANANQKLDSTELGLGGWQVFIDVNHDGKYDAGDLLSTTDINGAWLFKGLTAGNYAVRVVQVSNTATTTVGGAQQNIPLVAGQAAANKLFGEKRIG